MKGSALAAMARDLLGEVGGYVERRGRPAPVVETTGGRASGRWRRGSLFYGGIPYAAPPVGPLRFRPPTPAPRWTGVRDARQFGNDPLPHNLARRAPGGPRRANPDEDCLYLNVQTPDVTGRRPVLVWVHGGGFVDSAGSHLPFDGARLAERDDVVVVTLNYRLGALGWLHLGHRDDRFVGSGNVGLLDQLAALEWVRDNIGAFGGDPADVTVFGSSAGAMSIGVLLTLPEARGLFHRAIAQSGSVQGTIEVDDAADLANAIMQELGVRSVDQLQKVLADDLVHAARRTVMRRSAEQGPRLGRFLPFGPVVDGRVVADHPLAAVRAATEPLVPLIVGTNRDEWSYFTARERDVDEGDVRELLGELVGDRADALWEVYREEVPGPPAAVRDAIESDRHFRVPAVRLAEAHAQKEPGRTFLYRFDWCLPGADWGACHSLEQPFVFDCLEPWRLGPYSIITGLEPRRDLAERMGTSWTTFARTGVPAGVGVPSWPAFGESRACMLFDDECTVVHDPDGPRVRAWEGAA